MGHGRAQSRHTRLLRRVSRGLTSGAIVSLALVGIVLPASADDAAPLNAVSSTGGVATAEGSTSVQTGDIVTGMNTGHTVETGGTTNGDINVSVAEMSSESSLDVVAEIGPQIADASGGDGGDASTSPGTNPDFNVNINNRDRNNNESNASGVGEGGAGGAGGTGGDVTVNNGAP